MSKKIAICLASGRLSVMPVLEAFLKNAHTYGYTQEDISVYISVDTDYQHIPFEDFALSSSLQSLAKQIVLLSKDDRRQLASRIAEVYSISEDLAKLMFYEKGYSSLRNCALYSALLDGNKYAIFFDDDEYPVIPVQNEDGSLSWEQQDFFTPHLRAIDEGAHVTRGPYLGYISPVPSDFDDNVPSEIRRALGLALSYGNEVIKADYFMNVMNNNVRLLSRSRFNNAMGHKVVESGPYGKEILTGNMAIDLDAVRDGKIPLFYTPPQARGEDAIFAIQLEDVNVVEVNAYIFHDPFNKYPEILEGKYPAFLQPVTSYQASVERFLSAFSGWLKYAPLLVKLTSKDAQEEKYRVEKMLFELERPTKKLSEVLNNPRINTSCYTLKKYYDMVEENYEQLETVQKEWREKILSSI